MENTLVGTVAADRTPTALNELHNAIAEAHQIVDVLEKRLQPVIHNVPRDVLQGEKSVKEFSGHIQDAVTGVYGLQSRLHGILENLAV